MAGRDERDGGEEFATGEQSKVPGREPVRPPLPKRFYKDATVDGSAGAFRILLDGRTVKTPKKRELALPSRALAEEIAAEWAGQGERIDPETMPLTRLANVAIDAVGEHAEAVRADIQAFAASDLLCYRADAPEGLVQRQHAHWDPLLAWADRELGIALTTGIGVTPVEQRDAAIAAVGKAIAGLDPFRLAALHVMTTLTGSAVLALAHFLGRLTLEQAWQAAHVDESWQIEHWGTDAEAEARAARRRSEFEAASRLVAFLD